MKKMILCVLDGFGISELKYGNACIEATYIQSLRENFLFAKLKASGTYVGLPDGQFGNSEVGHLTIGSGRIVKQKLSMISDSIKSEEFDKIQELSEFLSKGETFHIMALFSNGGVHSHTDHFFHCIKILREKKKNIKAHLFLDGRDVARDSALGFLEQAFLSGDLKKEEIATIQGRFYAMDRDNRWDRTNIAYNTIKNADCKYKSQDPLNTIKEFYSKGIFDEVIPPFIVNGYEGVKENDLFWMTNFRTDRIKQIIRLIQNDNYSLLNMVSCDDVIDANASILFKNKRIDHTLGEILSEHGKKQLRIAETEKYAHVTYFLNGGEDVVYENEDRELVPSPKVQNYATVPDMSSKNVTEKLLDAINSQKHDVIIVNYSNADMIGHTGDFEATKESLRILDSHIKHVVNGALQNKYDMLIIADHGNAEKMINEDGSPNKTHSCSEVPLIYISKDNAEYTIEDGSLKDVAPTLLHLLNISIPEEMTGTPLIKKING